MKGSRRGRGWVEFMQTEHISMFLLWNERTLRWWKSGLCGICERIVECVHCCLKDRWRVDGDVEARVRGEEMVEIKLYNLKLTKLLRGLWIDDGLGVDWCRMFQDFSSIWVAMWHLLQLTPILSFYLHLTGHSETHKQNPNLTTFTSQTRLRLLV